MLTSIGNFCICSIAIGMIIEIIIIYGHQERGYRVGIDNLLVILIGGIPIAMPTVLSVTMAIGSHRLSQQVSESRINPYLDICQGYYFCLVKGLLKHYLTSCAGSYNKENDSY